MGPMRMSRARCSAMRTKASKGRVLSEFAETAGFTP